MKGTSATSTIPGLSSMKFTTGWVATLIALLLVIVSLTIYQKQMFDLLGGNAKIGAKNFVPHYGYANNELLGGLLTSGFDERNCVSRFRSTLYRKPSPHKPSRYLLSKLRNYENLHHRCGPYTESYNRTLQQLKSGQVPTPTDCNYVVWVAFSGLGNKILTMASAFLYALLTNRVLLIEQEQDLANIFCEPFVNTSWLLPQDFPVQFTILNQSHEHCYGNVLKNNLVNGSDWRPPSVTYLHLVHDYIDHDKLFFCDEYQDPLKQVPWLIMRTDNYFVPSLFLMTSFEQELDKLFPNKETVFHHLGRYLFHPGNVVWGLIVRFHQAYLAKADEIVGIQVRVLDPAGTHAIHPLKYILNQVVACSLNENLLPELDYSGDSTASPAEIQTLKAVLITSLYSGYYENISNMYWTTPTRTGEVIAVHQPSHEEYQQFGNNMHNMKAWAEMYLLSLSDVLVTSAWSTFGYVAQGLGGLKPWILYKPVNQTTPDPPCQRAVSLEPCFHSPPRYDCKAKIVRDMGAVLPHVRHCEDRSWGIKLFDNSND